MSTIFLEYAWDTRWCDPCAADPLTPDQLKNLGVFWGGADVFITRLHVRYDRAHFPDDLVFQETGDKTNFQGRYILRHPWTGTSDCEAARQYTEALPARFEKEASTLASITGWRMVDIRRKMNIRGVVNEKKWWEW